MKKIILSLLIGSSLMFGCKNKDFQEGKLALVNSKPGHEILAPNPVMKDESIYQLKLKLTDQDSKETTLGVYEGQPVMMSMFYATCPYSCPILIDKLKAFENLLDQKNKDKMRFVLISFDPQNDNSQVFQQVIQKHGLDSNRWKLLRTDENHVREVAAVLGIQYRKTQDGGFNHSALISVLDPEGKIKAQYETEKFSPEEAKKDLDKILNLK